MTSTTATVTALPTSRRPASKPAPRHHRRNRAIRRQIGVATGIGLVALFVIALSLKHQANGFSMIANCDFVEAALMAIGIEMGYVGVELLQIVTGEKFRRRWHWLSASTVYGLMVLSAGLNAFSFSAEASGVVMKSVAIGLGIIIPCAIFAFVKLAAAAVIDATNRT